MADQRTERTFRFDPRNLIMGPFVQCPACQNTDFGILDVHRDRYLRRCKVCLESEFYDLPVLKKPIVYLDQFAISNMMKAINPASDAHRAGRVELRWRELFDVADRLSRMQLVEFPSSEFHGTESLLSKFYEPLKSMYAHLSAGVEFRSARWIEQVQLDRHSRDWLAGDERPLPLDVSEVVSGELNGWHPRLRFVWNSRFPPEMVEQLRVSRADVHKQTLGLVERWKGEGRSFDDVYRHEVESVGRVLLGEAEIQPSYIYMVQLEGTFRRAGVPEELLRPRTREYLLSGSLDRMPYVRVGALLWASAARSFVAGRIKAPTQGLVTDIRMVSGLLPYCDAMLLDGEIAGYLRDEPLASAVQGWAKVFSPRTLDDLIAYLRDIEQSATAEHRALVETVYGPIGGSYVEHLYRNEGEEGGG